MRILHSADLHLGSPLRAAAARDAGQGARLRVAADGVLDRIVDVALEHRVDALVLAGDLFDREVQDVTLRARLAQALGRAARGGVPSVLIRGNHDALMDYDRYGPLGEGIHVLDRAMPSVRLRDAWFHGLGFEARHEGRSMLPDYPAPEAGALNIGLMHTSLDGAAGHDPYAPCSAADLRAHGYDYWALGHIHRRSESVVDGVAIVMPGIPQGRHAREPGVGSVTLATLGAAPDLVALPVAELAFDSADVALGGADQAAMIAAFADAVPQGDGIHRLMRFDVHGTDLPLAALTDFATTALEGLDASVERVRRDDGFVPPPDGLLALAASEAGTDSYRDEAARLMAELRDALPRDARTALSDDGLDALIAEGLSELAAALGPGG